MNSYKSIVTLGKLRPSGGNPRKDFGDLEALAQSMLATGGAPVSPIVCVADGDVYRIVDGERRWRALRRIHEDDFSVDVIVCADFSQADELVAMLATDDKMRLSPAEQARGFQSMMALGVDEERAARATRRDVEQVRRARRSLAAAEGAEQATLDALIVAGDDQFSDEERARIVRAGESGRPWETPETVAALIVADHKRVARLAKVREAIAMSTGGADVEFVDESVSHSPWNPRAEGLVFLGEARTAKDAVNLMTVKLPEAGVSPMGCVAYVTRAPKHDSLVLYRRLREGEEEGPSGPTPGEAEEEARREEAARRERLLAAAKCEMLDFISDALDGERAVADALPALARAAVSSRRAIDAEDYERDTLLEERAMRSAHMGPSYFEALLLLDAAVGTADANGWYHGLWYEGTSSSADEARRSYARVWDALVADGWQPPERLAEVREACGEAGAGDAE